MTIKTWQLFLILFIFIVIIVGLVVFLTRFKFKKAEDLSKQMGFSFFTQKNIPAEYAAVSKHLLYFWGFEFLSVGEVSGTRVYFTQYLQKRPSQLPYVYAIFSLFEKPRVFASDEERKKMQAQINTILPDALLTENGVFYYHPIPWVLTKENILEISKGIASSLQSLK